MSVTLSKGAVIGWIAAVIVILIAEGLIVGLVGRPTCDNVAIAPTTTPTEPKPTTSTATVVSSLPVVTTPAYQPWFEERLSGNLVPYHYEVDLRPVLEKQPITGSYLFYGSSSVYYTCVNSTDLVIMHSRFLEYDNDFSIIDVVDGGELKISSFDFYRPNHFIYFYTETPCIKGRQYKFLSGPFQGELSSDLTGLYRSEYVNEAGENRVIAVTQMEKYGARETFPCFDEPSMKSTFDITLRYRADQGYFAVGNMPVIENGTSTIDANTWTYSKCNTTVVMPTYLLAMVVCDFSFEPSATADGSVKTDIYGRVEAIDDGEGIFAAEYTPKMLDYLGVYYDEPYHLPKSDQLATPDFGAGAMENWGLVLYRESLLLYNEKSSSVFNKYSIGSVIGHELAHMWFGNLVTCAWWNELWLNEAFATYVSYVAVDGVLPEWNSWNLFINDELQSALAEDSYSTSHPLVHPEGLFSTITYAKGGSVLRMFQGFLGEDIFTGGLQKYLNGLSFQSATHEDLFKYWIEEAELQSTSFEVDLNEVFESWTLQMGYPLLTIEKIGSQITVSQEYFLTLSDDSPVDTPGSDIYGYKWYVPFIYANGDDLGSKQDIVWIKPDVSETLAMSGDFILANIDAVGFYRVNYPTDMWQAIANKLITSSYTDISTMNRAQLIDDIFALSRSGRIPIDTAFEITSYLSQELELIAWETFLGSILYFTRILESGSIYGGYSQHILSLVVPSIYDNYGWDDSDTSEAKLQERMARSYAIDAACYYGHPDCFNEALNRFGLWMDDPETNRISATYATDVYCTAIKAGGVKEWDFAWDYYLLTKSAQQKSNLRYALTCSKDPWILNRYMEYVLDTTLVRRQDSSNTMYYLSNHESSKYVAMSFLYNNWDRIIDSIGSSPVSNMMSGASRRFSTDYDVAVLESMKDVADSTWYSTIDFYIDRTLTNMKWRAENEEVIANWLGVPFTPTTFVELGRTAKRIRTRLADTNYALDSEPNAKGKGKAKLY